MDKAMTLLGLLESGCGYGYDLKQRYDRLFGLRQQLAFGQIYATLARLVRDGLIVEIGEEGGRGPDRRRYRITEGGRERIARWLFTPDEPHESLQSNVFAKTVIALLVEDVTHDAGDAQHGAGGAQHGAGDAQNEAGGAQHGAGDAQHDAQQLLDLQRAAHLEQMRALTRQKQGSDLIAVLLCDHALFHLEADLRWMDLLEARLGELRRRIKEVGA
jgi:DNA-binding PadR family transcriptional regulator